MGRNFPALAAGSVQALGETAFGQEMLLQGSELVVEEVIGLVDEAQQRIGGDFRRGFFDIGPIGRIGPIGLIGEIADYLSLRVGFGPQRQAALAEEILVVLEQFFQAGAGDIGESKLGFLGGRGGLAGFGDVLLAATGGLDHLVVRARAAVDEAVAERDRGIVNDLGRLVGFELSIPAMRRNQACRTRPICPISPISPIRPIPRSSLFLHARPE